MVKSNGKTGGKPASTPAPAHRPAPVKAGRATVRPSDAKASMKPRKG